MIKVFGVGRGKPASDSSGSTPSVQAPPGAHRVQPGQLRMQTEIAELELPSSCSIEFPDPKDLMHFLVHIRPDEGFWKNCRFTFSFTVKPMYPHDAPKVKCETPVYHPNIDPDGNVCLNILREDWKPILSISAVIYGLIFLFLEPNPNDPLNQEAAELLRNNRPEFGRIVMRTVRGGSHQGRNFPKLI